MRAMFTRNIKNDIGEFAIRSFDYKRKCHDDNQRQQQRWSWLVLRLTYESNGVNQAWEKWPTCPFKTDLREQWPWQVLTEACPIPDSPRESFHSLQVQTLFQNHLRSVTEKGQRQKSGILGGANHKVKLISSKMEIFFTIIPPKLLTAYLWQLIDRDRTHKLKFLFVFLHFL